ncbi:uncharacterized protein B0H64DRAFT_321318, partial [Chaetomium fimeti]
LQKFNGFQTCSSNGDYGSCLSSSKQAFCNCNNGMQYLDCVSEAIAASTCVGAVGVPDWDAYERSWFQSSCPTPPSSVMTQLPQPTSVQLDLQYVPPQELPPLRRTIITIIPSGPISQPPRPTATPMFRDGAELLVGDCQSTSYTLLDGGDMVLYAAFVGCNGDRPQCCPWNVTTDASLDSPGSGGDDSRAATIRPGEFPAPAGNVKDSLDRCPQDYYSVSGQCCPNGYYKFTRQVASQTPCFSSLAGRATPPPITVGMPANPTDTTLPTSAVVNLAWAMGFKVDDDPAPALSKGAVVGIGVGSGVVAVTVIAAIAYFVLRWRRNRRAAAVEEHLGAGEGMTYTAGYHAPQERLGSPAQMKLGHGVQAGGEWDGRYGYPVPQDGGYGS